jgi:RNase P subunit Pop3
LKPVGEHRQKYTNRSPGKRAKRQRRKKNKDIGENNTTLSVTPLPEVAHYIIIGFNSTMCHLQKLAVHPALAPSAAGASEELNLAKEMAAVFVCTSTLPALLTSVIPIHVAAASARQPSRTQIRLVSLPAEAGMRLASTLFQPRIDLVGLLQDAPGAKGLVVLTKDRVSPVDVPWLERDTQVVYKSVCIKTTTSPSKS